MLQLWALAIHSKLAKWVRYFTVYTKFLEKMWEIVTNRASPEPWTSGFLRQLSYQLSSNYIVTVLYFHDI